MSTWQSALFGNENSTRIPNAWFSLRLCGEKVLDVSSLIPAISSVRWNAKTLISGAQLIDPYSPDFFDGVQVGTIVHRPENRVSLGSQ